MKEAVLEAKPDEGRKGDGVMLVSQDNARRQLSIEDVNEVALSRLGYRKDELEGRKLEVILGHESALVIDEELEYDEHAPDFADVLARHRQLRIRLRSGKEAAVSYRIVRLMAKDFKSQFQLILLNDRDVTQRQQLREFLKTNLEGHQQLDAVLGLPNRETLGAFIERLPNFSSEEPLEACVAVIRVDRWEKSITRYGQDGANMLLKHVADTCRGTFRAEDVVAGLGKYVGLLLVGLSRESARVVLNRLRWNISSRMIDFGGKSNFSVTVSLAFAMLSAENSQQILALCEQAMAGLDVDARNSFIELGQ